MSEATVHTLLSHDHDRLDQLLETYRQLKRVDFARAKQAFREFKFGLQRHIISEETILFPLNVKESDADSDREVEMLVNELGGHNAREEYALHPQLDKLLSDAEKQTAFEAMSVLPEGTT